MAEGQQDLVLCAYPREGVVVITINRPERRNAVDGATAKAIEAAVDGFEADPQLRVAVLTGAGGVFCAGQDLKAAVVGDLGVTKRRGGFGFMALPPNKPVIAAVEGHALAGGLELCLACDLIVSSESATMGLPEAAKALVALGGGLFRLPKRIPYHLAMELALTGKAWSAKEFRRLGLINRLTEPGEALAGALELAEEILRAGPLAVEASLEIVRGSREWTEEQAWREQAQIAAPIRDSADLQEGLRAFAEKRAPVWKGR
jgi:enoyl-CoA hydratase